MTSKTRVLFLCTGNSARSQMAEAFLRHYASDQFEAYSAGLEPKGMNPMTVQVMAEIGMDISAQKSKSVTEYLGKQLIQVLVTVCDHAEKNCPTTWPGINQKMHWSFEDPAAAEGSEEDKLQKFREVRDLLDQKIQSWLTEQRIEIKK